MFRLSRVRASFLLVLTGVLLALPLLAATAVPGPPPTAPPPPPERERPQLATAVFLPLVTSPVEGLQVDPADRAASLAFYQNHYLVSAGVAAGWTGDNDTCDPGTTSAAFRAAVAHRINYFRAMAGAPANVKLDDEYNRKAQQAAQMMSRNQNLSHSPPPDWDCYTEEGAEAAGSSNLYLGRYGPDAITGYIQDPGSGNYFVGHRRWILYPQTRFMGSGDIPPGGQREANALWVFDDHIWEPRPATRDDFVAWPPPGYTPASLIFARWSFSYAGADFSNATVAVNGAAVTPEPVVDGFGENTLVWAPDNLAQLAQRPLADTTYTVQIDNVLIDGQSRNFNYQVVAFDPTP